MIKINLLPFRAARKKENIRRQVSIYILLLIMVAVSLVYYNISLGSKVFILQEKADGLKKEMKLFNEKVKEVDRIRGKLATIEQKTAVIKTLERNRKAPVNLLTAMTQAIIRDRMWLTELEEKEEASKAKAPPPPTAAAKPKAPAAPGTPPVIPAVQSSVSLKGMALDNKTVADFMIGLEGLKLFESVRLVTSEQQKIRDINMKRFEIVCIKAPIGGPEPVTEAKP